MNIYDTKMKNFYIWNKTTVIYFERDILLAGVLYEEYHHQGYNAV
jgi:hypothetical protein